MINDKEKIYERIGKHCFTEEIIIEDYIKRVINLSQGLEESLKEIENKQIPLAFSGGVDSSLLLAKLLKNKWNGKAYTLANAKSYPDIIYSKIFAENFRKKNYHFKHETKIIQVSQKDIQESNRILWKEDNKVNNYYMLMKVLAQEGVKNVICGDIVDELFGGYYKHSDFPIIETFRDLLSRLIPEHLNSLDKLSSEFGIKVFLPYGNEKIFSCASKFSVDELVKEKERKRPIYEIAKREGIPQEILERRKYGFCSAF